MNARGTVEDAIDDLRKKFGNAAVIRGIVYDGPERRGKSRMSLRSSGLRIRHDGYFGASAVLHGFESLTSNFPSAPEMTKSL